jgi:hypothetical protein
MPTLPRMALFLSFLHEMELGFDKSVRFLHNSNSIIQKEYK